MELVAKEIAELPKAPDADELLEKASAIGDQLRALIVECKKLPRDRNNILPHKDPSRSLSLSQMYMQTGFMWLRNAIKPSKEF